MRILLATDGSEYADEAVAQCGEIVSKLDKVLVKIITVADYTVDFDIGEYESGEEIVKSVGSEIRKKSNEILAQAEKIICDKNKQIQIEKEMFIGSAKKLIVKEAEKWNADLIVVGSHGYGFFARTLLGSVSDTVVHHSPCSVLIVRVK